MTPKRGAAAGEAAGSRQWTVFTGRRQPIPTSGSALVAALNDVADAVCVAPSLEDVLAVIVERARLAADADEAVLALTNRHDGALSLETPVCSGATHGSPTAWWEKRLLELGPEALQTREAVIEPCRDRNALMLRVPMRVRDHPIGVICALHPRDRSFSEAQVEFLGVLAAFAAVRIENARLAEQDRYLLLSSERSRIAREIHDGVVQSLFSVSLGLEVCKKLITHDPQRVAERLDDLQEHLNSAMGELRRFVYDLRSSRLKELGLERAIDYWIREVAEEGEGVQGRLVIEGVLPPMSPQLEACLYRVAKESVSNVVKHAEASHFEVRIVGGEDMVMLVVEDDGCGFDVDEMMSDSRWTGVGLVSIRERVEREGGRLAMASAPERGTRIAVEFDGLREA